MEPNRCYGSIAENLIFFLIFGENPYSHTDKQNMGNA